MRIIPTHVFPVNLIDPSETHEKRDRIHLLVESEREGGANSHYTTTFN
jgi:hypothetical protein